MKDGKKYPIFIISIVILLMIISITLGTIVYGKNRELKFYDETIGEENSAPMLIKKDSINMLDFSYKEGDRVNIIIRDKEIDYDYDNTPYMENVQIYKIRDDLIQFWAPSKYASLIGGLQYMSDITIEIKDPTDENGAFNINKELYDLFESKYTISSDNLDEKNKS